MLHCHRSPFQNGKITPTSMLVIPRNKTRQPSWSSLALLIQNEPLISLPWILLPQNLVGLDPTAPATEQNKPEGENNKKMTGPPRYNDFGLSFSSSRPQSIEPVQDVHPQVPRHIWRHSRLLGQRCACTGGCGREASRGQIH